MRHLKLSVDAADHQRLVVPIKLKRLAHLEGQRNERLAERDAALLRAPGTDEVRQLCVAAFVPRLGNLLEECFGSSPLLARAARVGQQRHLHRLNKR